MSHYWMALALLAVAAATAEPVTLAQPFRAAYTGADATGPQVTALWSFDGDAASALKDASGKGHDLVLRGGVLAPNGKFGGALQSGRGYPVEDKQHAAVVAKMTPDLSPKGAFTLELWLQADDQLKGYTSEAILIDCKYADQTGYQLALGQENAAGARSAVMRLGFGTDSAAIASPPALFAPGAWHHLAFTYDGAGTGRFFLDGAAFGGETLPGRGGVAPAQKALTIGDRVGSYYHGFPGLLDQVRLSNAALEFRAAGFDRPAQRTVFVRLEPQPSLRLVVANHLRAPMAGAKVAVSLEGKPLLQQDLPELASGAEHALAVPFDTRLRPQTYQVVAALDVPGDVPFHSEEHFAVTIVPRRPANRMPVVMWGGGFDDLARMKECGFTHFVGFSPDYEAIWKAGKPTDADAPARLQATRDHLEETLQAGLECVASIYPLSSAKAKPELRRVGPDGKPIGDDICAATPGVPEFWRNVGASVAKSYGDCPALTAAIIDTETRDASNLCYHPHDHEAAKKALGFDLPKGLTSMRGTSYKALPDFPANRVIPDDYPIYRFYQYWWQAGDGWCQLHTAAHEGLKSAGRSDWWTWYDPAVRVASTYGSGGNVDYLSQWTYSYPDPIRIAMPTDELFCMAGGAGRPDQRVMKMTQIIWYRSQTAPAAGDVVRTQSGTFSDKDVKPQGTGTATSSGGPNLADWEREQPDARFITIAPMHLREAFWTKIARPIQGIMYHGWGSLVRVGDNTGGYRFTHPDTQRELRRLVDTVVEPLGPTLKQVPDAPTDVVFLESFASQMFAGRGSYGWAGGWGGDVYEVLQYAQLQPRVMYEETVRKQGLDGVKVLVMPDCDVLPKSVADAVKAFQARGGLVIGDDALCPAIHPDMVIARFERPKEADKAKQLLLERAAALRKELDPHYPRRYASSNPEVVTHARRYGEADYLFAVNDRREFGDYVGQHKLVMENGLPSEATLTLRRAGGTVYDLVEHQPVPATLANGLLTISQRYGPCEGRVLMVTDQPIAGVKLDCPAAAAPGAALPLKVAVVDPAGKPLRAIVPVQVEILDPAGRPAELSGYYAAKDGQLQVDATLAPNDRPGTWRIRATELASGKVVEGYLTVK